MVHLGYVRYLLRIGVYFATLGLWGVFGTPVALLLAISGRRFEVVPRLNRSFYHAVGWMLGMYIKLEGAEHLTAQPVVLMLNHQSALDVWFLGRSVRSHTIRMPRIYPPHIAYSLGARP
jgi:lysophosphatidate acyltransferase